MCLCLCEERIKSDKTTYNFKTGIFKRVKRWKKIISVMSISTVTSCRPKGYLFVFMGGDFESDNYEFGKKSIKTTAIVYIILYLRW